MFYLKRNLPTRERVARIVVGVGLAMLAATLIPRGAWLWAAEASALALVGTAIVGFCPACRAFGRRSA